MAETFYVGGYWGSRRESVEVCAGRLEAFLTSLAGAHPLLGSWFKKGGSRRSALRHRIEPVPGALRELLLAGRPRRDDEARSEMEDLGFLAGLWNGSDVQVGLMITCGAYPPGGSPGNAVVLSLPKAEGAALGLYRPDVARMVMAAMVAAWEPSWATWTSRRLREAQHTQPGEVVVGWKTYLGTGTVPDDGLPVEAAIEAVGDGVLITIGDDPVAVSESAVIAVRGFVGSLLRSRP